MCLICSSNEKAGHHPGTKERRQNRQEPAKSYCEKKTPAFGCRCGKKTSLLRSGDGDSGRGAVWARPSSTLAPTRSTGPGVGGFEGGGSAAKWAGGGGLDSGPGGGRRSCWWPRGVPEGGRLSAPPRGGWPRPNPMGPPAVGPGGWPGAHLRGAAAKAGWRAPWLSACRGPCEGH